MKNNKEILLNLTKFIDANPDIKRIGINKEDFESITQSIKSHGIIYEWNSNEFVYKNHVVYKIGN